MAQLCVADAVKSICGNYLEMLYWVIKEFPIGGIS